jgi:membrane fusion protein (multidrug efflux system)
MKRTVMLTGLCAGLFLTSCKSEKEAKEEVSQYKVTAPLRVDTTFVKEYVSQ